MYIIVIVTTDLLKIFKYTFQFYVNKEILCKCLLECKDEILVFTNFTSLVLISTMIALLVILFITPDDIFHDIIAV